MNARRPAPGDDLSLDTHLMQQAAACLAGRRCFAAFRDPSERPAGNTVRHVWHLQVWDPVPPLLGGLTESVGLAIDPVAKVQRRDYLFTALV